MRRPTFSLAMLRDAVAVALLAVLTVQALRRQVGDRYLVPTGSMEPLLHGHPEHGDIVFVDKRADPRALRVGDLVVVRHPTDPGQQVVKRIAASGDDPDRRWIDILQGDLWLGADAQHMAPLTKEPFAARGQRALWARAPEAIGALLDLRQAQPEGDGGTPRWRVPGCGVVVAEARRMFTAASREARQRAGAGHCLPAGAVGTAKPVDAGFIAATGERGAVGNDMMVNDAGLDLTIAEVRGELLATIETRFEALTFHWQPATGRVVLWRDGVDAGSAELGATVGPTRLEFGLLDERVFFGLGGDPDRLFVAPRRADGGVGRRSDQVGAPRTLAWVQVPGGMDDHVVLTRFEAFHDVFAWRDPIVGLPGQPATWPRYVGDGHWFLLGDSAFDSHDSRQFGPVPTSAFLGVPCCVLGPWPRTRMVWP
ncbi:MAG: S26 family signal peptidase [Planctomycetota bacterium]